MRRIALLALCLSSLSTTTAEARLFLQTYGSTIPNSEDPRGGGCSWNWNQDFFVPRAPSSGHYGLFSSCKIGRTSSPACVGSNPLYPGYCSIYGSCHYGWRNHVYGAYCGCTPVPINRCGCTAAACPEACFEDSIRDTTVGDLPNVESSPLEILGSISVEGDGLLSNLDMTLGGEPDKPQGLQGPQTLDPNLSLPALLMQQLEKSTQPLPLP